MESVSVTNAAERMRQEQPGEFTRSAVDGYVMDPKEQLAEDKKRALPLDFPLYPAWIVADIRKGKQYGAKLFVWDGAARDFLEQTLEIT